MSYLPVETIEIAMNMDDGTYRLQQCRESESGRMVLRTVFGTLSIIDGLRQLALEIQREALGEFSRPRGDNDVST